MLAVCISGLLTKDIIVCKLLQGQEERLASGVDSNRILFYSSPEYDMR